MNELVTVLLSTYNGENYIKEQLQSIFNQTYPNIEIVVRDDGSKDNTIDILESYEKKGKIVLIKGNNMGPTKSFLELIRLVPNSDFYSLCDQDDIWFKDKIKNSVETLLNVDLTKPSLYFSEVTLIDKNENRINEVQHNYYDYADNLPLALVRNISQGCTMVFNNVLANYINQYEVKNVYMHDWWIYLVCLSLNGNIVADSNSQMYYRQHDQNVIGSPSLMNRIKRRTVMIFSHRDNIRVNLCKELLDGYSHQMNDETKIIFKKVVNYRDSFIKLLSLLFYKKFYSNSLEYNLSFSISVLTFVF